MVNKIKKVIGYTLLVVIIPLLFGLVSLDGKFCYHGNCTEVFPFWGGVEIGFILVVCACIILAIGMLIIWLIA